MSEQKQLLTPVYKRRYHIQGYDIYTDQEIYNYKHGIRFAYLGCGTVVAIGLVMQNIPILAIAMAIAFLAVILPIHPFDYLYNNVVRHMINKPALPKRTNQGKFACGIATVWLAAIIYLLMNGYAMAGNILGGLLLTQAFVVGTIAFCVPSMIYNALFKTAKKEMA